MTDLTAQERAVLRTNRVARHVHAKFTVGTRVVAADGAPPVDPNAQPRRFGTVEGTVKRHIPMPNAQGGTIVVEWDNGITGRTNAGSLALVSEAGDR